MYRNYLVPFDGSDSACRALNTAISMGSQEESVDITVLQVLRMTDPERTSFDVAANLAALETEGANGASPDSEIDQAHVQDYFDSLPRNVDLNIVIKRGNPGDIICDYAHDNDIECIVMGRRGLGGIRAVLGSVSTAVLRGTDLPVLVVK